MRTQVKWLNLGLVLIMLAFYNVTVALHTRDDEIARLEAELETATLQLNTYEDALASVQEAAEAAKGPYLDGEYTGSGTGYSGPMTVQVTVQDGYISSVEIVSTKDDSAYLAMAVDELTKAILKEQSAEVDLCSGATFSSTGIRDAVKAALEGAEK